MWKWPGIEHFEPWEFDQRTPGSEGTGFANMDIKFIAKLDRTRELYGKVMVVTSGWRSKEHDAAVCKAAGKPVFTPNAHVNGHAADIACTGARERYLIIAAAITAGINRIGFDNTHIHLDDDPALPANVLFWEG